ncbi:MAG: hypothetical protein K8E24_013025 [Methanobacterium paludis]|nr:hypothetical protein [Methanobacterium paludis]
MANLIQGGDEYVYFMIQRTLECVGTGDGIIKSFTVSKKPIADSNLDGSVTIADVECYTGSAKRQSLVAVTPSTVTEDTGEITFTTAPTTGDKVYVTYKYVLGHVVYAQDYSASSSLQTTSIQPLSESNEETFETGWKYEGSMKLWDADGIEDDIILGIDQSDDTVGGKLNVEAPVPAPLHHMVLKKVRGTTPTYKVLREVKCKSLDESGKGGDIAEKDLSFDVNGLLRTYTPSVKSGM